MDHANTVNYSSKTPSVVCGNCGYPMDEEDNICQECKFPVSDDEQVFWYLNRAMDDITYARDNQTIVKCREEGTCVCNKFDEILDSIDELIKYLISKQ